MLRGRSVLNDEMMATLTRRRNVHTTYNEYKSRLSGDVRTQNTSRKRPDTPAVYAANSRNRERTSKKKKEKKDRLVTSRERYCREKRRSWRTERVTPPPGVPSYAHNLSPPTPSNNFCQTAAFWLSPLRQLGHQFFFDGSVAEEKNVSDGILKPTFSDAVSVICTCTVTSRSGRRYFFRVALERF
ncbi:hypothetical protein V9T40_002504 [Parthenolecanium corni]|uniref:Uncharacterized protein n=1 Tax=Parthenolecanium corni TaxID=536013 RepID=A0AAN9TIL5_9HEMI